MSESALSETPSAEDKAGKKPLQSSTATSRTGSVTRKLQRHGINSNSSEAALSLGSSNSLHLAEDGDDTDSATGSSSRNSLQQGVHTTMMLMKKETEEGAPSLMKLLMQVPGIFIYPLWLAVYLLACAVTKKLSKSRASCSTTCRANATCSASCSKDSRMHTAEEYASVQDSYKLAAACFGIMIFIQLSFICFQISSKKRVLGSLMMLISLIACTTYLGHFYEWMHPVLDSSGEEIQISRYLEWAGTTTMMLLTISASGNTMNSSLVKSWSDTAKLLMWDELMILCGLLHSIS
jgi:hypothetical protein